MCTRNEIIIGNVITLWKWHKRHFNSRPSPYYATRTLAMLFKHTPPPKNSAHSFCHSNKKKGYNGKNKNSLNFVTSRKNKNKHRNTIPFHIIWDFNKSWKIFPCFMQVQGGEKQFKNMLQFFFFVLFIYFFVYF